MSKYGRLLVRELIFLFAMLSVIWVLIGGIGAMSCYQNTAWNCDVPIYLATLAATPENFAIFITFLAIPFFSAAFEVTDEGSHLVARILWPVFGFLLAAAMWVGMFAAYIAFLQW